MILPGQKETFDRLLSVLRESGMIFHVMLVGSWAEYIYEVAGLLENYRSSFRTRDIDFLIRNLRRPPIRTAFLDKMKEAGFELDSSRATGIQRFLQNDVDMEVEFLIQERGSGGSGSYMVESLGIRVPGLRNMEILSNFPMTVEYDSYHVIVPTPEAYVIHKLVINGQRAQDKQRKDIESIWMLIEHIRKSPRKNLASSVWKTLSQKQKKAVLSVADENILNLDDFVQEA